MFYTANTETALFVSQDGATRAQAAFMARPDVATATVYKRHRRHCLIGYAVRLAYKDGSKQDVTNDMLECV